MSLQIRRGTDAERLTITPLAAELIYTTDTQLVYVGDGVTPGGILVGDGGGNGNYGNANVVALLGSGVAGDIIPVGNSVYSLGSPTTQWKDLYISNNTIYINNVPLSANGNVITYDGVPLVSSNSNENISTTGNISGGNLILELSGAIVFPDGSTQTTAVEPYTDANVASFLAGGTDTSNIVTSGNISGGYFIGNGSQLTGLPSGYANSDVAAFLASGNDTSNIITTANISGSHIIGNGSALTSLTGANVTGEVPFAAVANSVAAANITGSVANATYATTAGTADSVAGANVTGTVANATFATTASVADSVAGSNVTGAVGLATYASIANSVAGANVTGEVTHAATANSVAGANVTGAVAFATTANSVAAANVVGTVAAAGTAATVTTNAQPNITSVGTLTSLAMSGNINAGSNHINNLADPSSAQDAATKAYVDATSSGLSVKGSVNLATTAPLSAAYTYDNGASGVGAYILATTVGQLVIDGVNASVGDRVLIKNEVGAYVDDTTPSAAFNGIYVVLDDGVSNAFQLERATDCDTAAEIPAAYTLVTGGSTLTNTGWVDNNTAGMTVGTTSIVFVQFSAVTTYTGGSAIDVTGTVISAKYDGATITTNGSNQLVVGTVPIANVSGYANKIVDGTSGVEFAGPGAQIELTSGGNLTLKVTPTGANVAGTLTATGNVTGDYFIGNGSQLTGLPATYSNADVSTYLASGTDSAGIITTGNITGNVVSATTFDGDGALITNITGGYVVGDVANAAYATIAGTAGTVYTNAQPNITSVGTLVDLTVTGNVTGDYFIGNGSQLTGLPAGYANSDVANYLASNANVVVTTTGNITTTANVEAGFFIGDGSQLTNLPPVPALSIPAVYFNVTADGNNQTFSNTVLSAYTSNTEITLFYNGALLDSPYYTLSGDTLTINTDLSIGDSIDVIRQFASNVIVSTYSNSDVSAYLASGNDTANIVTTGNISGAYFIGNGSQLTGLPAGYSNADVSTYLASGTDTAGIVTTGNVTANRIAATTFSGDGALITNITGGYVVGDVANAAYSVLAGSAATVYDNAQPNITSVGTLTSLAMSGNINAGTNHINNLSDPVSGQDAATKSYVDAHSSGLSVKGSSALATTAPLSAAYTYNNGTAGVGATITASTTGQLVIDGVNATVGARVLIKNEVGAYVDDTTPSAAFNGIYVVTDDGSSNPFVLTRATDCDTAAEIPSAYTLVTGGSTLANTGWVDDNDVGLTVGTTSINFVQFSSVTTYSGGSGIDVTGTVISALYDGSTITTNGNDELVVATVPGANVSGEVAYAATANSVAGGNVTGQVANALVAGTVYTAAQPNITSVGTLVDLTVTGNVTGDYFIGNGSQLTGLPAGYANSDVANYLASNANVVINTTGNITSTANVTAAYFIGDGSQLTNLPAGDYSNANVANYLPTYTGALANVNMANSLGVLMGTPTQGSLVSNAVTLTTTTALTNGIALLNNVLGKLVPPSPPAFPASQTLSVSGLATYRMANTSQVDNIPSGGHTVAGGSTVTTVKRTAAYTTNTIATAGPGDSGTVTALRNEAAAGSVTLTGSSNGTYGNLIITNNQDYNLSNSSIAAGFWYVFSSALSGTVPAGWNSAQITDTAAGSTNTVVWYYDASAPGTPQFSSVTMTPPGSPTVIYSSTIPNYTNVNQFAIGFTANRLSGDMYPTSDTFATGTAGGAFAAPASRTYQLSSLGTNVLTPNASASVTTTATIISGFGSSSTGPSISVVNSYATGTQTLTAALGNTVLYKTGTSSSMEETNITIGSPIGSGTTPAFRIDNPGSGDTPVFTGSEAAFDSQTGPLETYDATIVAAILKHDQTNYSTGYLPVGPDLSVGRSGAQYFTFKFVRTATSKFDVKFSGTIAGMWIALPGSVIDTASTLNGWIDASVNYAGSGVPGANIAGGGNGSNGCGLGSTAPLNTLSTNVSTTCTFGTASSSSTATNEIYVRIKLTAGQTVTALSLQTGSR